MKSNQNDGIGKLRALDVARKGKSSVLAKKYYKSVESFLLRLEAGEDYDALMVELDLNEARLCFYIYHYSYIRALYQSIIIDPTVNIVGLLEIRMIREIMRMKEMSETKAYKIDTDGNRVLVRVDKTVKDSKLNIKDILQVLQSIAPEKWKGQTLETLADSLYDGLSANSSLPPPPWASPTAPMDARLSGRKILGDENAPAVGQEPISD